MSLTVEELRPFLRFCQCVGLIPFRMEMDPITKKFWRFSFSLKYPITWWYILLLFLTLIGVYLNLVAVASFRMVSDLVAIPDMPMLQTTITMTSMFTLFVRIIISFGARLILLRHSALGKMLQLVQQVEDDLKIASPDVKTIVGRRILYGGIFVTCFVRNEL